MGTAAEDLWLEFLGGTEPCPNCHCGLCGNTGIVDTVGKVFTPMGHPCGVRWFCICPNGRAMKEAEGRKLIIPTFEVADAQPHTPKSVAEELVSSPDFDDRIQYAEGVEPSDGEFNPNDQYFADDGETPNCRGCSMCGGTHVVVNNAGHPRPCDYCDCEV